MVRSCPGLVPDYPELESRQCEVRKVLVYRRKSSLKMTLFAKVMTLFKIKLWLMKSVNSYGPVISLSVQSFKVFKDFRVLRFKFKESHPINQYILHYEIFLNPKRALLDSSSNSTVDHWRGHSINDDCTSGMNNA